MNHIRTIAVVGAGTMGQGIARSSATAGYKTLLYDVRAELVENAVTSIVKGASQDVQKGRITPEQQKSISENLSRCLRLDDVNADIVIEAIVEKIDIKRALFAQLEKVNGPKAILATNTSSLSVTEIGSELNDPGRVIGIHFFNPAHLMKLVELIYTVSTRPAVLETMIEFSKRLGKTPVLVKDSPGFIVNRVARHFYVESLKALEDETGDIASIDRLLRSAGFKMGPFELMDLIGIDTNYYVTTSLYHAFNDHPKFKPSKVQEEKVKLGQLGRKTGKGFYDYEKK